MMQKFFAVLAAAAIMGGCAGGETTEEVKDTANTLSDTFPAATRGGAVGLDSNPPDATHVDSMNNQSR